MKLDLTNEQHRKALRIACETLLLPGMPADAAADLAARADVASPAQLAFLALALPEQSAAVVHALLEACGVDEADLCGASGIDAVVYCGKVMGHGGACAGPGMRGIPALILALLEAKNEDSAVAVLGTCQDVPAFGPTRPPPPPPPPGAVAAPDCECPTSLPSRDRCGDGWIRCNAGLRADARRRGP